MNRNVISINSSRGGIYGEKEFYGEDRISFVNWPLLEKHFSLKAPILY